MPAFSLARSFRSGVAALPLLVLVTVAAPVQAQQPLATFEATVRSAATAEPLRGAQVVIDGTGVGGITDERGRLRLAGLGPGVRTVRVRLMGYASERRIVQLAGGKTNVQSFALEVRSIPLAEVRVRVRRGAAGLRRLADLGFFRRKETGPGAFITRSEIESRNPTRLSDMLRMVAGVRLAPTPFGHAYASMGRSIPGRRCPIQYYIDGVPAYGYNIDDMPPRDVEGVEIYRGASETPATFNRGTAHCGVIVLWTRID